MKEIFWNAEMGKLSGRQMLYKQKFLGVQKCLQCATDLGMTRIILETDVASILSIDLGL